MKEIWMRGGVHPYRPIGSTNEKFVKINSIQVTDRVFHKHTKLAINANFVFPYICSFLHYLCLKMLVNEKLDISVNKGGLPFKVTDFISFNFEWHGLNEVGNIAILVLWRDHEKLWWQGRVGGGAPTYNLADICFKKKKSVTKRKVLITWFFLQFYHILTDESVKELQKCKIHIVSSFNRHTGTDN